MNHGSKFHSSLKSPKQQQKKKKKTSLVSSLNGVVRISVSSCRIYVFGEAIKVVIFIRRLMECLLSLPRLALRRTKPTPKITMI